MRTCGRTLAQSWRTSSLRMAPACCAADSMLLGASSRRTAVAGRRRRTGAGSSSCRSNHGRSVPPAGRATGCRWHQSPAPLFGRALEAGDELIHQHLVQPPRRGNGLAHFSSSASVGALAISWSTPTAVCTATYSADHRGRRGLPSPAPGRTRRRSMSRTSCVISSGLRGSAMQRAAASIKPSLRSTWPSSITPPSLVMLPPSKHPCTTRAEPAKVHAPNVNFFGTVWLRHCPLVDQDSTPGFSGTQGQCRPRLWLYYGEIFGLGNVHGTCLHCGIPGPPRSLHF